MFIVFFVLPFSLPKTLSNILSPSLFSLPFCPLSSISKQEANGEYVGSCVDFKSVIFTSVLGNILSYLSVIDSSNSKSVSQMFDPYFYLFSLIRKILFLKYPQSPSYFPSPSHIYFSYNHYFLSSLLCSPSYIIYSTFSSYRHICSLYYHYCPKIIYTTHFSSHRFQFYSLLFISIISLLTNIRKSS